MGIEQLLWYFLTHCFWLGGMGVDASSWTAEVPSSVSGLQGSPIVIPCSFKSPDPEKKPAEFTGIWLKDKNEVIYHKDSSKIIQDYKGRTELVGDLLQKNCSLRINPLHCSDKGPFTFRIEIKDYNKYSYKEDTVSIVVCSSPGPPSLSVMEEVKVGEEVSASCSVSHSCPSDSPRITWSHSGISSVQSQQLTKGQWEVTSSLTFNPSSTDHNQSLVCTAAYRGGGKTTKTLKTLNVKYAPVDVKVKGVSSVKEGDSVELRCSSDSNPAAHSYRWHNSRGRLPTTGPTLTLENVTRLTEALYCTAINTEGQGQSSPLKLNVEYPPEIKVGSACTSDISMVTCLCIVNLEPPGTVEWSLPAEPLPILPSTRHERHGSVTMVTLQRALGFSETVHCHASNTQGNATLSFTVSTNDKMLMLYVSIGIAALVVVVILVPMSALLLNKKGGRSRSDLPVTSKQDMDTSKCASSDPSTSREEQKDTSSEINTNYYTSNHLYGNIEAEEDGDPFECEGGDDSVYGNM